MMRFRMLRVFLLPLTLGVVSACGPAEDAPSLTKLTLEPCRFEGLDEEVKCGTFSVAENRAEPDGRRIDLNIVVLPALGDDPAPDPIFHFSGGPGAAAAENPAYQAWMYAPMRQRREVVLIDQRGTGKSHQLDCPTSGSAEEPQGFFEPYLPVEMVEACRDRLSKKADLELYTTSIAMDDIDEVREALGYEQINVVGESYGTRAVQVFMRRHPERIRTSMLLGTAAMHQHLPLFHAADAQRTMDLLLEACAEEDACDEAFPDLADDLASLMGRLAEAPVEVALPHPITGEETSVQLGPGPVAEGLRFLLYSPSTAVVVPQTVHEAAKGELGLLARLIVIVQADLRRAISFGMHLSVTCAEDRPFYPAELDGVVGGTFLGDFRVAQILGACEVWPRGEVPEGYHDPVTVDVPTLLVSGHLDPVTPPSWADAVDAALPNSRHVVVEHGHHSFGGLSNLECFVDLIAGFVEAGSHEGLDTSCVETMRRGAFVTEGSALEQMVKSIESGA